MDASRPNPGVSYQEAPGYFRRLSAVDWLFAAALMAAALLPLTATPPSWTATSASSCC